VSESPASQAEQPDRLTDHIRGNYLFFLVVLAIILVPPAVVYFGPSAVTGFADWTWVGFAWGFALALLIVGDEVAVHSHPHLPGLSHGVTHGPHKTSYRVFRSPVFLAAVAFLFLAPSLVAFYMPQVLVNTPDWLWLLAAWAVAAVGAGLAYWVVAMEEAKGV
jgi:hypothetical protein